MYLSSLPATNSAIHLSKVNSQYMLNASVACRCAFPLVSSPDPDSQQLRVDYITATATIKGQSTSLYTAEVFSCFKAVPNGESDCLPDPGRTGAEPSIHIGWSNIDLYYIIRGLPNLVIGLKYGCVESVNQRGIR